MSREEDGMIRIENEYGEIVEYTDEEWEDRCIAEEIARAERLADMVSVEGEYE